VDEDAPLTLDDLQRQVLLQQIAAFSQANPDPQSRQDYVALADAVSRLEVPTALLPRLTAILEIVLSSDRIRRTSGPGAHLALMALFQKTPRGREIAQSLHELNTALSRLKNDTVEEMTASMRGPGAWALTVKTSGCQMVIRFDRDSVRVESLEVALG